MRKMEKLWYLVNMLEEADPLDTCHVLAILAVRYAIRKFKLRCLFDGTISGIAVLLFVHTVEPRATFLLEFLTGAIIGLLVIIFGGFNFQPNMRSRNNSAE